MNDHDDDLRRALHGAVSDVHPHDALDDILARTTPRRHRSWLPVTLAAAAAVALVVGGVGAAGLLDRQPATPAPAAHGEQQGTGQTGQTAPAGRSVTLPVYYLGDTAVGKRLFREYRSVDDATGSDLDIAIEQALSDTALDPDYHSGFPSGTHVLDTAVSGGQVVVDLHGRVVERPEGISRADAEMAINAIVFTADAVTQTSAGVSFRVDGQPTDTLLGVPVGNLVGRADADSVESPIWIIDPVEAATVKNGFKVNGLAATFEGNVVWELKQGSTVVRHGFTTAQECCTMSPYSFTVDAPSGRYTLVVHDTDESGGEGPGVTSDTKDILIQ